MSANPDTSEATDRPAKVEGGPGLTIRAVISVARPHQWIKNSFVLAPLVFGLKLTEPLAALRAVAAAAVFCLLSSALYIINDILDAPSDRLHAVKRYRPIASGSLPVRVALVAAGGLLAVSFLTASQLGAQFLLAVAAYSALMGAYNLKLKRVVLVDCMVIACGFVLRVAGGAVAVGVHASHWLILCAFLLALYLAFAKRRHELMSLGASAREHRHVLSRYSDTYLEQINNILLGTTLVCYALYTVSPETIARFGTDQLIYGTIFVVYGLFRYKLVVHSVSAGDNPSQVVLRDAPLLICVAGWAIFNAVVIYRAHLATLWPPAR